MHDDDLRARLAAYAEHDSDAPAVGELLARADGRRRRRSARVLSAVAVVAAAAIVLPPLLQDPNHAAPSPVATGTPLPTVAATPSPRVPPSPTPRPAYTPSASCAETRSAWMGAFTGTTPRRAGLPGDAAVMRESGDTVLVTLGPVEDATYRLYAHGLDGPFVELPKRAGEQRAWFSPGAVDGRMALVESGHDGGIMYAIDVVEPGSTERRRVVERVYEHGKGGWQQPVVVRGDVLQWTDYETTGSTAPADITVWELDLSRTGAEPAVVKRVHALGGDYRFRFLESNTHFFFDEGDGWVGVDRQTFETFPVFWSEDDEEGSGGVWGTTLVQERIHGAEYELHVVDLRTGASRLLLEKGLSEVRIVGDFVLVRDFSSLVSVIDLKTDNVIDFPGLSPDSNYFISEEAVGRSRRIEAGDRGNRVPLESLPTVFPTC